MPGNHDTDQRWIVAEAPQGENERALQQNLGLHPLVAGILGRRGVSSVEAADRFLNPSLEHLHDPFQMKGMEAGVARIIRALEENQRIVISGDYDVDGITSSAVLTQFLRQAGCGNLEVFIPNRFDHGYGLTDQTVEALMALSPELVITVDNGITAIEEVARMQGMGVDTVITDHHQPRADGIPPGIVINPRQPDCPYPFRDISGCGVTFKLITALRKALRDRDWWNDSRPEPNLKAFLDLVAIGTIADVVPLLDENRILVRHGLEVMNRGGYRPGVAALLAVSRVKTPVTSRKIAFQVAPRINAAGRMSEGSLGVALLLEQDAATAEKLALGLDEENTKRRSREEEMLREAVQLVTRSGWENQPALVVSSPGFHEGIIGIIAARLVDRFHCPAVVLAANGDGLKGSIRSVPGLNVTNALTACAEYLTRYGGHAGAAGCSLPEENLEAFRKAFIEACQREMESAQGPVLEIDGRLEPDGCDLTLAEQVEALAPFGHHNEEPLFLMAGNRLGDQRSVMAEKHLKWRLPGGVEVVAWNQAGKLDSTEKLGLLVKMGINEFRGNRRVQLILEDYRQEEPAR